MSAFGGEADISGFHGNTDVASCIRRLVN